MDIKNILIKIIILIYKSRLIKSVENDDLIRTILNTIKVDSPEFNFNIHNFIKSLKDFAISLLEEKDVIVKKVILQYLSIILENDVKLLMNIKESLYIDYDDASNKRIITSLVKLLNNYYKEYLAIEILNKVTYDLKFNRSKISNFSDYLKTTISNQKQLTNTVSTIRDPALVNEVDFENPDSLNNIFEEIKNLNSNKSIYKFGWHVLNRMLQGEIRRSEFCTVFALQHKYKTGMMLSLFMQITLHNSSIVRKLLKKKIKNHYY